MVKINNKIVFGSFLIVFFFSLIIGVAEVSTAGIKPEDSTKLNTVRAEIEKGNLNNLLTTLDNTDVTHLSIVFGGMENSKLIDVWNKMGIKTNGVVDRTKTDKYRNMLLIGIDSSSEKGKEAVDSFIGELIRTSSKSSSFEFVGSKNSKETVVEGDFINLKDSSGNVHKVPLKDLSGFKKMVFSEMKKGGEGYAVHYIAEKGIDSAAILSSGYLVGDSLKGYGVMDLIGEVKSVGHVNFGESPSGAIYFRGIPKDVDSAKFTKGDYIFHKPGREGDISFRDGNGALGSSSRDIGNADGDRVGYQSENGIRGIKKLENGDNAPDKIIDIVHQNGVGVKYGDKVIGAESNKKIEINDKGNDIEVTFSKEIINAEIINNNGKTFALYENSKKFSVGKGEAVKFVNGKINGLLVDRQGSFGSDSGRITQPGSKGEGFEFDSIIPPKQDATSNVLESLLADASNQLVPDKVRQENQNLGKLSSEAQTHRFINQFRGTPLQLDAEMSRQAREYSKVMAARGRLVHSNMNYAENIAMFSGSGQLSPEEVGRKFSTMWIKSQGHRENILGSWSREGIGIYRSGDTYYATQIFQ